MDKKNAEPVQPVILPDVATEPHPSASTGDTAAAEQKPGSEPGNKEQTQPVPQKPVADATE